MKNLYLIPLLIAFFLSIPFIAQETDAEGEPPQFKVCSS